MQHKLTNGNLINKNGVLDEAGYAYSLVKAYNKDAIAASKLRIKEWDYYFIQTNDFGLAITVSDNGYMGLLSVSFIDYNHARYHTKSKLLWFPLGNLHLPRSSQAGTIDIKKKHFSLRILTEDHIRHITLSVDDFMNKSPLTLNATLYNEPTHSMVIATPFKNKPKAFYYNHKLLGMNVKGTLFINHYTSTFTADDLALLDWGRGVWPYHVTWYWAAIQGIVNDKKLTLNLGYGFGDLSNATENVIIYDDVPYKLKNITFNIPKDKDGKIHYLDPWTITDDAYHVSLVFTPTIDREDTISLGILKSDQHQVFGTFSGDIHIDKDTVLTIKNVKGFAEVIENKW